jgi:dolichol-phosphate mannosyltransferase
VPTYQEAANIVGIVRRIRAAMPSARVLVVDDGSPDGTADLAQAAGEEIGGIEVLRRPRKSGLGSAYREAFQRGLAEGYEVFVEMDADFSHDPSVLPSLVGALHDGTDLAIGSRYVPGGSTPDWSWHRKALSRWGNRYVTAMLRLDVRDATAGYRAYRADILRRIDLPTVRADGYGFQIEMTYRVRKVGGSIVELPIEFVDRTEGESKMSGRIIVEAMSLVTWWGVSDRVKRRFGR